MSIAHKNIYWSNINIQSSLTKNLQKKKNLGLVHKTHASNTERMQPKGLEGLIA